MKPPKIRKPRAKPSVRHKSKKDYDRDDNQITAFKCHKCGAEFFTYPNYVKKPTCMECWDWTDEAP